jgi:putative PIN family toxin of toxin-antitoxin system
MTVRAVYDCMIFLQAASNPDRIHSTFRLVDSGTVILCVSADVLAEVRDVLTRPRHMEKFPALTAEHVSDFIATIASRSKLYDNVPDTYTVHRDPKDSRYVNLALAAGAEFLVSWDKHLLGLMDERLPEGSDFRSRYPALRIVCPVDFLREIGA